MGFPNVNAGFNKCAVNSRYRQGRIIKIQIIVIHKLDVFALKCCGNNLCSLLSVSYTHLGIFTEIHMGDLYFCLEQRLVRVDGQVVDLTAKEFDILALLITHPQRVFTYELIMELVWNEDVTFTHAKR